MSVRYARLLKLGLLFGALVVAAPASAQWATAYIPISGLPTEDVDMVELVPQPFGLPPTIVFPTEGTVEYIDMTTDLVYASVPKPGPNISGVDYVPSPDGTIGVMPILGALCVFSQGPGPPALLAVYSLPGTPARRDIDVQIVPGLVNPWDAIYATGTEVHRIDLTTGGFFWTTPTPTPIVEAVDPLYVPDLGIGFPMVYVATDGFMREIDAITGAIVATIPMGTTVIRELDPALNPASTLVFLHANFLLNAYDVLTGALVSSVPLGSMGIEGNDIEWDNTGTRGVAITVASMVWFDAATGVVTDVLGFGPYGHQRNQDLITTAPGYGGPQFAGYLAQGAFFRYSVPILPGAVGIVSVTGMPSPTMDGVDPLTTDAVSSPMFPPAAVGVVALIPTQGFISEMDLRTGAMITLPPLAPGVLRTDVDVRRGGTFGNKNYQPYVGGVAAISGFIPSQYTVTVSTGIHVIDVSGAALLGFIPTGMIYRGGDEQVTTLLGPLAPPYTTDQPDQDFLTKCWEYKYAMNRWPMWYATSHPIWYPHFMPYGVFGPPALMGWDIWNDWKVMVLNNQSVAFLNRDGFLQHVVNLPAPPIGGLIWDWDNKICKLRLRGQQEAIFHLSPLAWGNPPLVTFVPYLVRTEWYPIVDRRNGWEFVVARGARRVWCYDHVAGGFVTWIDLPARITRPPVFDEQRKTLCAPLANRQVWFFDAHRYRVTGNLLAANYYSPILPRHVVADPVFDIYNHHTLVRCQGGEIVVLDNKNGNLLHNTGFLPHWPIGPIQVDCYNKIAKWNAWNGAQYVEYWLDMYPLRNLLPANLRTIALGAALPFGYPVFDSRDGWEFTRINNVIRYDYLFNPFTTAFYNYPGPFLLTGNLFLDRVNKYGLVATTGNRLLWLNLFRLTQGMPGGSNIIALPAGLIPTQGIHFVTQLHLAVVVFTNQQVGVIDCRSGTFLGVIPGVQCRRQIYVQPFSGLCNWPWWDGFNGSDITVDLGPIRQNPSGPPQVHVEPLPAPSNEASNFVSPPNANAPLIQQMVHQVGDDYTNAFHFQMMPGAAPPGVNYQVHNQSTLNTANQMDPVSGTTEDDGSSEFAVVANPGETICIQLFDPEGNASGQTCKVVQSGVGVGDGPVAPTRFALEMISANPVSDRAAFRFALPTRSRVDLDIFDMSGRRITTLVSQERDAGEYDVAWDLSTFSGENARAGVYFAKFRAGSFEETRRVIVVH